MPTSANQMLVALPAMELQHLLDIAASVSSSSETWLREYPIVKRPSVTAACALVSTVAMPGLAVPELDLLTRWWLWIFGVDDVLDDLEIPDEPVAAWVGRFLHDPPTRPDDSDPLRAAFGSIHHDLRRYPLYPSLGARWRTGMVEIVRGMLLERRWSGAAPADQPSYEAYLDNATATIALRPYTLTAAILAGFLWAHTTFVWDMYQFGDYDTLSALLRQEATFDRNWSPPAIAADMT